MSSPHSSSIFKLHFTTSCPLHSTDYPHLDISRAGSRDQKTRGGDKFGAPLGVGLGDELEIIFILKESDQQILEVSTKISLNHPSFWRELLKIIIEADTFWMGGFTLQSHSHQLVGFLQWLSLPDVYLSTCLTKASSKSISEGNSRPKAVGGITFIAIIQLQNVKFSFLLSNLKPCILKLPHERYG